MHSILYMLKQSIHSLHNIHTCNGMHVDAVDTINVDSSMKSLNYIELEQTSK